MSPLLTAFEQYNDLEGDFDGSCQFLVDATKAAVADGHSLNVCVIYYTRIFAHYSVREYNTAMVLLEEKNARNPPVEGSIFESFAYYLHGLCLFACARQEDNASTRKSFIWQGRKLVKKLQKLAVQNPDSCLGKATLLEAEYASLGKKDSVAKMKYSEAMALSAGHNNFFEMIFSKQAAGLHYIYDLNDPRTGIPMLEESIDVLKDFGGHAVIPYWEELIRGIKDRRRFSTFRYGY